MSPFPGGQAGTSGLPHLASLTPISPSPLRFHHSSPFLPPPQWGLGHKLPLRDTKPPLISAPTPADTGLCPPTNPEGWGCRRRSPRDPRGHIHTLLRDNHFESSDFSWKKGCVVGPQGQCPPAPIPLSAQSSFSSLPPFPPHCPHPTAGGPRDCRLGGGRNMAGAYFPVLLRQ